MSVLPAIQELLDQIEAIKPMLVAMGFKHTQSNVREAFANAQRKYMTDIDYTMPIADDIIYNDKYPVAIRIYRPRLDTALPVAVFVHGGGHMCGSITQYDGVARKLAKHSGHIIVSIDYRLSPEFAYPTGINDCKAVICGLFNILDERKISYTDKNLSIIGDSAGGGICASIAMDKEFVAKNHICHQVLIYPTLDYSMSSESIDQYAAGYFLEKDKIEWYYTSYLQNNEDRKMVSPLYSAIYADMPATLVIVARYDPLHNEGVAYFDKVVKVGAKAELSVQKNMIHGYLSLEDLCKTECTETYQQINAFLAK